MLADYHMHTSYSVDSSYPMEDVIKDAIRLGLDEICITDHQEFGFGQDIDAPRYVREILQYKEKYKDEITIKLGLEFGLQRDNIDQYEKLYSSYDFDFIILSIHSIGYLEFWDQGFQTGKSQEEYNQAYYDELLYMVKNYKNYSVLGHLDAIVRYDKQGLYPFEKVKDKISEILKVVIEDGKGIELNTSSKRYGIDDLTPSREILKLYRDLGGKIVTIGSDSHKHEHLGKYIIEAKEELKKIGFTEFTTFDKMVAEFHKL